jgi:chromosome segregation ATPase
VIGGVVGVCKNANDINESIEQLETDLETLKKKLEDIKQNLRTARKKKDNNQLDITKLEEIRKTLREEIKMFQDRRSVVSKDSEDVTRLLTTYSGSLARLGGERQNLDSSIREARIKTEKSKSEYETSKNRREDLIEKTSELLKESDCLIKSSKAITTMLSTTVDTLKKVKAESANLKLNKESAQKFFQKTMDEIIQKNSIIKGLRENYDNLKNQSSKVLNENGSLDLNGLSSEITKMKNIKISEDVNLNKLKESGKNLVSNIDRNIKAASEFKNEIDKEIKIDKEISKTTIEMASLDQNIKASNSLKVQNPTN